MVIVMVLMMMSRGHCFLLRSHRVEYKQGGRYASTALELHTPAMATGSIGHALACTVQVSGRPHEVVGIWTDGHITSHTSCILCFLPMQTDACTYNEQGRSTEHRIDTLITSSHLHGVMWALDDISYVHGNGVYVNACHASLMSLSLQVDFRKYPYAMRHIYIT